MSSFVESIKERAQRQKKSIVLPEGTDIRVVKAALTAAEEGIADIILLGSPEKIRSSIANTDFSQIRIIEPEKSPEFNEYSEQFYEMRRNKGLTLEKAYDTMHNPLYYGCMLVKTGAADGMVGGAVYSTGDVMRSALQIIKTSPDASLVSAFFIMCVPDCRYGENGVFLFADSGLNENPNANQLADIAIQSAASFRQLIGAEPQVALLSYSTKGSAKSELVDKVIEAARIAKTKAPWLNLDGELQLDAAIDSVVGAMKAPASKVAGKANVLVFPDLNCGNISYKLVQRLAKAEAYGAVTQGLAKPINDLSRGCTVEDIVGQISITAVQAQN